MLSNVAPIGRQTTRPRPEQRPYAPRGAARDLFYCQAPEILIEGPAGTGKTRAVLEKIHLCCSKYAGARWLIVRKTRASMTESVLKTYEDKVLPADSPIKAGPDRSHRQRYTYPNGSEIVVGGMDLSSRIMSTEYDGVAVFEATECSEGDIEDLTTRLRNGVMPYQQLVADCNPAGPAHWLNQRAAAGKMVRLLSRHTDNPSVTPAYLATLASLSGARKARLLEGKWAAQEGLVYDFDPRTHIIPADEAAAITWREVFGTVDWGFTNPGVLQVWGVDGDGRLYLRAEVYETGRTLDWWMATAQALKAEFGVTRWVCDTAEPAMIAAFNAAGLRAVGATKEIRLGISKTQDRLKVAGDGKPRFFVVDNAYRSRDPVLLEKKRPINSREEVDGYHWPPGTTGKNDKEVPVDEDNHGMDGWRYAVMDQDGPRREATLL